MLRRDRPHRPHGPAAAQRELAEEADLAADRWDVLADITSTPGGNDEVLRLFLARDLRSISTDFVREGEEADLELRWVPLAEAVQAVLAGRMANAAAGIALLVTDRAVASGFETLRGTGAPSHGLDVGRIRTVDNGLCHRAAQASTLPSRIDDDLANRREDEKRCPAGHCVCDDSRSRAATNIGAGGGD